MNLRKDNIVSYLLNETARCGLRDMSLRDVAIDYFMHDSDGVLLTLVYQLAYANIRRWYQISLTTKDAVRKAI